MAIDVTCECGQRLIAKDSLAGRVVKCPMCARQVEVPQTEERNPVLEILDEEGVYGSTDCPNCIPPHEIICIKCGYNKELGRKMGTNRR